MNLENIKARLINDEGKRSRIYKDTLGNMTIGVGHNLMVGISEAAIDQILDDDIETAVIELDRALPWWRDLDDNRQDALVNMCFNMGINRLTGFHDFLTFLQARQFPEAAASMLKSLWADQVGQRAARLAAVIKGVST